MTVGGAHTLSRDFSVAGLATLTGVQTLANGVAVSFNGTTNAATAGVATIEGTRGSVSYGGKADVYGGNYGNLTISGAHTLTNAFTVAGTSRIDSVMSGTANVTFKSGAETLGGGSFGTSETAYAGVVNYAAGVNPYDGFYTTLELDGSRTIDGRDITVTTTAKFNGEQRLTNGSTLTLKGTNSGTNASIDGALGTTVQQLTERHLHQHRLFLWQTLL